MRTTLFQQKVYYIRPKLMADFGFSGQDANAIIGNLAHETGGFRFFQEINPTVPGSRGGFGWAQWTGYRRRLFEAYCLRYRLDRFSDKANYGFLRVELRGSEKPAVAATKRAFGLKAKVRAFEKSFERAGAKHYASRLKWAKRSAGVGSGVSPRQPPAEGSALMAIPFIAMFVALGVFIWRKIRKKRRKRL